MRGGIQHRKPTLTPSASSCSPEQALRVPTSVARLVHHQVLLFAENNEDKKQLREKIKYIYIYIYRERAPNKSYVGPFFCVLSREMLHINSFLVAQNGVFGWGAKSLCWRSFCAFFCPLIVLCLSLPPVKLASTLLTPAFSGPV